MESGSVDGSWETGPNGHENAGENPGQPSLMGVVVSAQDVSRSFPAPRPGIREASWANQDFLRYGPWLPAAPAAGAARESIPFLHSRLAY